MVSEQIICTNDFLTSQTTMTSHFLPLRLENSRRARLKIIDNTMHWSGKSMVYPENIIELLYKNVRAQWN